MADGAGQAKERVRYPAPEDRDGEALYWLKCSSMACRRWHFVRLPVFQQYEHAVFNCTLLGDELDVMGCRVDFRGKMGSSQDEWFDANPTKWTWVEVAPAEKETGGEEAGGDEAYVQAMQGFLREFPASSDLEQGADKLSAENMLARLNALSKGNGSMGRAHVVTRLLKEAKQLKLIDVDTKKMNGSYYDPTKKVKAEEFNRIFESIWGKATAANKMALVKELRRPIVVTLSRRAKENAKKQGGEKKEEYTIHDIALVVHALADAENFNLRRDAHAKVNPALRPEMLGVDPTTAKANKYLPLVTAAVQRKTHYTNDLASAAIGVDLWTAIVAFDPKQSTLEPTTEGCIRFMEIERMVVSGAAKVNQAFSVSGQSKTGREAFELMWEKYSGTVGTGPVTVSSGVFYAVAQWFFRESCRELYDVGLRHSDADKSHGPGLRARTSSQAGSDDGTDDGSVGGNSRSTSQSMIRTLQGLRQDNLNRYASSTAADNAAAAASRIQSGKNLASMLQDGSYLALVDYGSDEDDDDDDDRLDGPEKRKRRMEKEKALKRQIRQRARLDLSIFDDSPTANLPPRG